jgi:hypothetical protein
LKCLDTAFIRVGLLSFLAGVVFAGCAHESVHEGGKVVSSELVSKDASSQIREGQTRDGAREYVVKLPSPASLAVGDRMEIFDDVCRKVRHSDRWVPQTKCERVKVGDGLVIVILEPGLYRVSVPAPVSISDSAEFFPLTKNKVVAPSARRHYEPRVSSELVERRMN